MSGASDVAAKRVDLACNNLGQVTGYTRYADLAGTALVATSAYTYDSQGRLTNLVHEQNNTQFADYEWTWDTLDRITAFTNSVWTAEDAVFDYDRTSQLISAERANNNDEAYSYDENGNRTMSGYTTGDNNQLLTDGTYDYEYDAEGNRTKKTHDTTGAYVTYTWDHRNRLTAVKFYDSNSNNNVPLKTVTYTYDALNRRVSKSVDETGNNSIDRVERYVYDAAGKRDGVTDVLLDDVALVFNETGSLATRALHGPAIDQLFASEDVLNDETFWSLTDHQGTVRDIATYNSGTAETKVINHITYTTFGQITAEVDPSNNNAALTQASLLDGDFRQSYTGREYDADVELYYYRERWYDAAVGQFTLVDPMGFEAGDSNEQRYVNNAPTFASDPSGLVDPNDPYSVSNRETPPPRFTQGKAGTHWLTSDQAFEAISLAQKKAGKGSVYLRSTMREVFDETEKGIKGKISNAPAKDKTFKNIRTTNICHFIDWDVYGAMIDGTISVLEIKGHACRSNGVASADSHPSIWKANTETDFNVYIGPASVHAFTDRLNKEFEESAKFTDLIYSAYGKTNPHPRKPTLLFMAACNLGTYTRLDQEGSVPGQVSTVKQIANATGIPVLSPGGIHAGIGNEKRNPESIRTFWQDQLKAVQGLDETKELHCKTTLKSIFDSTNGYYLTFPDNFGGNKTDYGIK